MTVFESGDSVAPDLEHRADGAAEYQAANGRGATRGRHPKVKTLSGQTTAQIPVFAAVINRDIAIAVTESPKITLAAAVLAFKLLDPETQVAMISQARVEVLRQRDGV